MIYFLVSPNGLGHLNRVLSVTDFIFELNQSVFVKIFCTEKQYIIKQNKRMNNNRLLWDFSLMAKYPQPLPYSEFKFNRYMEWIEFVSKELRRNTGNMLVSDNIVLPMNEGINFFLMGSFLWSDIYQDYSKVNNEIKLFYEYEEQLLRDSKSRMITNKYMAMPSLMKYTIPIMMPWFCQKKRRTQSPSKFNLLITLGAGNLIEDNSYKIIEEILNNNIYHIYTDEKLFEKYHKTYKGIVKFNFTDFSNISLIICRPGIGILTEAVKWSIPLIAISESNKEIKHNAQKIDELGLGLKYEPDDGRDINEMLNEITKKTYDSFKRNYELMETGGDKMAAEYFLEQYNK